MRKQKNKKTENLVHVQIEYDDALNSKKDVLSSEVNFLRIIKSVKAYQQLRLREFRIKLQLLRKIKAMNSGIKTIQKSIPKISIPKKIRHHEIIEPEIRNYGGDVERELLEIQKKLNSLNAE